MIILNFFFFFYTVDDFFFSFDLELLIHGCQTATRWCFGSTGEKKKTGHRILCLDARETLFSLFESVLLITF